MSHSKPKKQRAAIHADRASGAAKPANPSTASGSDLSFRKLPRQTRSAATVAAIIEAAACILENEGFEAYTTNAVAERAGVSVGSLYQYFPNKDAITRALIAREKAALTVDLSGFLNGPGDQNGLKTLINIAATHQLRRPALARLLDIEESRLPLDEEDKRASAVLSTVFRHCLGETHLGQEPRLAQDLVAIIKGMVDMAGQRGERDHDALVARVSRAVFGYLDAGP